MTRNRDEFEERNVERAVRALEESIEPPAEEELRALAQSASAVPRALEALSRERRRLSLRPRWAIAAVAAALLVGSGLGFGVGNSVTPTVRAGTSAFTGTGFLPAQGWNVVQAETAASSGRAAAIAANVPLHPKDRPGRTPAHTIASLPPHGVLIHATFATRGHPVADMMFTERRLPLQVAWATRETPREHRLRAGTGGYNIDARIYFGTATPSAELLGEAQLQLGRLVVAPTRVTLSARPTSLRWSQPSTLFGAVSSGKADEEVTLQAKDCGQKTFTGVSAILTHAGGSYSTDFGRGISSTIRAVWNGEASQAVELRQQPSLFVRKRDGGRVEIGLGSRWTFWHKRVLLQRRVGSRWVTVKRVLFTETFAHAGTGSTIAMAEFRPGVPRGSLLRAMLPADQAKPCYLPTASDPLRF
jgi:hypothetical protein